MSDGRCSKSWHGVPCRNPSDHADDKFDPKPAYAEILAERDRLKASWHESEKVIEGLKAELDHVEDKYNILGADLCEIEEDRDFWKSKAEKLAEAIRYTLEYARDGSHITLREALAEFEKEKRV